MFIPSRSWSNYYTLNLFVIHLFHFFFQDISRHLRLISSLDWGSFERLRRLLEILYSTANFQLLSSADFYSSNIVWSVSLDEGRTGVFSWCVISSFYFSWNVNLGNYSSWFVTRWFCLTREEPELLTDIRDFTTQFYVILGCKFSEMLE